MTRVRGLLLGAAAFSLALAAPSRAMRPAAADVLPRLMLWAWERPADLRALGPDTGVAFLAQTIAIDDRRVRLVPRRQPLRVADAAVLIAVTRIEFPITRAVDEHDLDRMAVAIVETAGFPRVKAVQIDFDATESQRPFYGDVIRRVHARLGDRVPLSITALASWCVGDPWLEGLPIDEAVPMLFELGPMNEPYREVARSATASRPICRRAIGIALNEPLPLDAGGRRVYVFNHQPWSPAAIAAARRHARGDRVTP